MTVRLGRPSGLQQALAMAIRTRPEIVAPAGDVEAMRAAVRSGADAVYFGLESHSARARAKNFATEALDETMRELHASGVRGYVALNTLVFDEELPAVEAQVRACSEAGVDAVIVQDLGLMSLVRAVAPGMRIHASTQMTCTDAAGVEFARSLGASRAIVARGVIDATRSPPARPHRMSSSKSSCTGPSASRIRASA